MSRKLAATCQHEAGVFNPRWLGSGLAGKYRVATALYQLAGLNAVNLA